jgi:hypothetical protein
MRLPCSNQAFNAIRVQSSIEEELIIKDQLQFPMNEIALDVSVEVWSLQRQKNFNWSISVGNNETVATTVAIMFNIA